MKPWALTATLFQTIHSQVLNWCLRICVLNIKYSVEYSLCTISNRVVQPPGLERHHTGLLWFNTHISSHHLIIKVLVYWTRCTRTMKMHCYPSGMQFHLTALTLFIFLLDKCLWFCSLELYTKFIHMFFVILFIISPKINGFIL